jgi:hypothetical protein
MTPQGKAKELIDKFDDLLTYKESKTKVKQCALIAVDEVISVIDPETNYKTWEFYKQVKQEIEKL